MQNIDFSKYSVEGARTMLAVESKTGLPQKATSLAFSGYYDNSKPIYDIYLIDFERFMPISMWLVKRDIFIQTCLKYRTAINNIRKNSPKIPDRFTNLKMFIHNNPDDAHTIEDFYYLSLYAKEEMYSGRDSSIAREIVKKIHEASNTTSQQEENLVREMTEEEYININTLIVMNTYDDLTDDFFCYYIPMLIKFIYYLFKTDKVRHDYGENFARFVAPYAFFAEKEEAGTPATFALCESWIEKNKDSDNIISALNIPGDEWKNERNEYTDILLNDVGFPYLSKDRLKFNYDAVLRGIFGSPFEADAVFQFIKMDEPLSLTGNITDEKIKQIYNMSAADFINKLFIKFTLTQGRLQKRVCNDISNRKPDSFNVACFVSGFKTTLALALMNVICKSTRAELDEYKETLDEKTADIEKRQEILEEQESEFKKNKDQLEQKIARLEAQLMQKNKENASLRKDIAIKDHQIKVMEHEIGEDTEDDIDDAAEIKENEAALMDDALTKEADVIYDTDCLADMKIIFVGGQNNMLIRLQKKYPNWTYIGFKARGVESMVSNNTEMVVVAYNYIDHQTYNKAIALTPEDCPIVYVKKTNIDYIEQKIMREKMKHENEVI